MRRDARYRVWIALACGASVASGIALWCADAPAFGLAGIAAGAFHLLWGLDVPARWRGRLRRRAIVIPQLRAHVVSPPTRSLAQRLRTWWRDHG